MEFKKITITDFLSYFDKNEINFSGTTTVFIGKNNSGKSKLFDAFNWCLYNRVWDKSRNNGKGGWISEDDSITELASYILNNTAKFYGIRDQKQSIKVFVELIVSDGADLIKICKTYSYLLSGETYKFETQVLQLSIIDETGIKEPRFYEAAEARDKLNSYFSKTVRNFFLFQGEAAVDVLNLGSGSSFKIAVRDIARLTVFEKATEMANKFVDSAQLRITKLINKNKKDKEMVEQLESIKNRCEDEVKSLESQLDEACETRDEWYEKYVQLESELQKYDEFEDYFKQKKDLEDRKHRLENQAKMVSSYKAVISEDAVFYKVLDKINSFKDFYIELERQGEVPPSIPIHEIQKAIRVCKCTICGTDLSEGTPGRKYAEARLPKCDTDKFGKYLNGLNTTIEDYAREIKLIPQRLTETLQKKEQFEENRKATAKELSDLKEQLEQINLKNQNDDEIKSEITKKKKEFSYAQQMYENARANYNRLEGKLESAKNNFYVAQKNYDNLGGIEDEAVSELDRLNLIYARKIQDSMKKLNSLAHESTYKQIEDKANEYYHEMTKNNPAIIGDIKIDLQNSELYTVDENGNKIRNMNTANVIIIRIAVLAGIMTIASEQFDIIYPFVTDAPVNTLDGDNAVSTINTIINSFEQSIIILPDEKTKDSKNDDKIRELIKTNPDIELAYELKVNEATNIMEQYTTINVIKE